MEAFAGDSCSSRMHGSGEKKMHIKSHLENLYAYHMSEFLHEVTCTYIRMQGAK